MKRYICLFALLFSVSLAWAENAPVEEAQVSSPINEAIFIADDLKVIPNKDKEENLEQSFTIDAAYPQIEGTNLSFQAQQFNKLMSEMAAQEIQQFKKYVAADKVHMQTLPPEMRKNSLHMDYDIDVVKPGKTTLVSVRLKIEGMQAGRAHPYHTYHVLNMDVTTGKVLELKDIFKPGAKFLNVIASDAKKKLTEKLTDKWMIDEGTKPVAKNFKNWNLENDGLLITFEEYQVAPYVYGAQEIQIPYADLKNIISPKAVIYPCVLNPKDCALVKAKV